MTFHARHHAVIVVDKPAEQRVSGSNAGLTRILTAGAYQIEVFITFTDDCLPYEDLRGHVVSQLIRVAVILRTPGCGDITLEAVLHNSAEQKLDRIRFDGAVVAGRIVVPEVFTEAGISVSRLSMDTGLDTVTHLAIPVALCVDSPGIIAVGPPPVHKGFGRVAPGVFTIDLVCVTVTRECDHNRYRCIGRSECCGRPNTDDGAEAHQECKQSRHAFFNVIFHSLTSFKA